MKISRRNLILAGSGGIAVLAGRSAWILADSNARPDMIASVVRDELPYMRIPAETLNAFVADYVNFVKTQDFDILTRLAGFKIGGIMRSSRSKTRQNSIRESIASKFLLSTDFFSNGSDISQQVNYVAFADPYQNSCSNPLAKI